MSTKNRSCHCSRLSASLAAALAAALALPSASGGTISVASGPASALKLAQDAEHTPAQQGDEFYLEVVINLAPTGRLARFVRTEGRFFADASTLRALGLKWPGSEAASRLVRLDDIEGLQASYEEAQQRMLLNVPAAMLDRPTVRFGARIMDPVRADPALQAAGLILNYDLYARNFQGNSGLSAFSELRLFGLGAGIWTNTASTRLDRIDGIDRHDSVRLDTTWWLPFPERMISLSVGDTITGALSWSRPTRIGGVRLASDFGLQPYRITAPLASFAGEATLPSTVDLFINGIRQSSQQVPPGQFQLDATPTLSGAGTVQMVVTDINGASRALEFQFYGTPRLLEPGLSDWSIDLGWIRREYGLKSFSYADDPLFSASLRHGLGNRFTIEAHGETTRGLEMAGLGGIWLPGTQTGLFSAAIAASREDAAGSGTQRSFGYQWTGNGFNLSADITRRSAEFRDAASLEGGLLPLRTEQAFAGMSTRFGQWSTGYVRQEYPASTRSRYFTLGWSRQFLRAGHVSFGLVHDVDRDHDSAWLSWWLPLDRRRHVSAIVRQTEGTSSLALQAQRAVDGDLGGWGWRAQASGSENGGHDLQAQIDWLGNHGSWNLGASNRDGDSYFWGGARGGLLWMAGRVQSMRNVSNAFAIVSTSGVAGVPVRLENRLVGRTDRHGLFLVDRLNPWQRNKLSIDPLGLPPDMRIEATEMQAVPFGRTGLLARFPMHRIVSVQVTVRDVAGHDVPMGSPVWPSSADPATAPVLTVIGHDGLLFLEDPPPRARYRIRAGGSHCEVTLPDVGESTSFVKLEDVICR